MDYLDSSLTECEYKISKIDDIRITKSSLNNIKFTNSKIDNIEIYNNTCNEVYLYSSKINTIMGDINNLRGFYMSMEQILDLIDKIGINLHE